MYTPVLLYIWGCKGVLITWTCYPDVNSCTPEPNCEKKCEKKTNVKRILSHTPATEYYMPGTSSILNIETVKSKLCMENNTKFAKGSKNFAKVGKNCILLQNLYISFVFGRLCSPKLESQI